MTRHIVFLHGAWVNDACWNRFTGPFIDAGYICTAPCWPHLGGEPVRLRARPPAALATVGIADIVAHYVTILERMPTRPILIGHGFGGLFVQMLLQRGLGKCGVAIHSVPPRGVVPSRAAFRANAGHLRWGDWRRVVTLDPEAFARDIANGLPVPERLRAYHRYVVPSSGRLFFEAASSLLRPRLGIDFGSPHRGPLLLIGGTEDRLVTADIQREIHRRYRQSPARTDYLEFPGRSHWTIAEPGWPAVAAEVRAWIETVGLRSPARQPARLGI